MASSGANSGLEELLAGISREQLDRRISDTHLDGIARSMVSWREVYLGLDAAEEESIVNDHRRYQEQKLAALRRWREKLGRRATYRNLARAFHEAGLIDTIQDVMRRVINTPDHEPAAGLRSPAHRQGLKWTWILGVFAVLVISLIVYQYQHGVPSEHAATVGCPPLPPTLKAPIKHFVGRDAEMKEAIESLQSYRIVNIVGPPGFGKSALAISVGHQLKDNGHDIIFIDMSNVIDPHNLKQWILHIVNITTTTSDTMVDLKLQKWASGMRCSVVIILDGCDSMFYEYKDELYRLVKVLVETSSNISVLTTSRHSLVQPNAHGIALRELSLQSAITLMGKLHPQLNITQRHIIANATGNAPLALVVIGALLHRAYAPTPDEVISDLQDRQTFLATLSQPDMFAELQMDSCIQYSYKFLDIQSQTMSQYLANFPASFTADAACCIATGNCELTATQTREGNETRGLLSNLTQNDCKKKLNDLVTRSLLELDKPSQRYRLHKLIQEFLHTRQSGEIISKFEVRFVEYYLHNIILQTTTSVHTLLSEKANIVRVHDIRHAYSLDDHFQYSKKADQMFFFVAEQVNVSLLYTSVQFCQLKHYTACAIFLEKVFQHNSASRPVVKAAILSCLLSIYSYYPDNDPVLEVLSREGVKVYPLVMEIPNSELLDTQYFDAILIPLYQFYLKLGRQEWAYSMIEKNIEIWKASDLTMSKPMRNAVKHLKVEYSHYLTDKVLRVIDAEMENTRRILRKVEGATKSGKVFIPDDVLDVVKKVASAVFATLELQQRAFDPSFVLNHVDEVLCVFDQDIASSLCQQMDSAIDEWDNLPHQQLRNILFQKYYESMHHAMKRYKTIRARIRFCTLSGTITLNDCSVLPSPRDSKLPDKRWTSINQYAALFQNKDDGILPSHIVEKNNLVVQVSLEMRVFTGFAALCINHVLAEHGKDFSKTYWTELKSVTNDVHVMYVETLHEKLKQAYYEVAEILGWMQDKVHHDRKTLAAVLRGNATEVNITVDENEKRITCVWDEEVADHAYQEIDRLFAILDYCNRLAEVVSIDLDMRSTIAIEMEDILQDMSTLMAVKSNLYHCREDFGFLLFSSDVDLPKGAPVILSEAELHSRVGTYTEIMATWRPLLKNTMVIGIRQSQEVVRCECFLGDGTAKPADVDESLTLLITKIKFIVDLLKIARPPGSEELRRVVDGIGVFREAEADLEKFSELQTKLHSHFCAKVPVTELLPVNSLVQKIGMSDELKSTVGRYMEILHLLPFSQLMKITGLNNGQEELQYLCVWDTWSYDRAQELLEEGTSLLAHLYHSARKKDMSNLIRQHRESFYMIRSKLHLC